VRQLPAMRFDESDAVEQQRFGAPTHKRNSACGDDVQCVRIGARRRKDRWALECFPFVALGRDLRGDRNDDAELAIARDTGDGRRDDPVRLEQKAALEMKPPECAPVHNSSTMLQPSRLECIESACRAEWTFWALNCTELPSESRVTSTASPALAAYAPAISSRDRPSSRPR